MQTLVRLAAALIALTTLITTAAAATAFQANGADDMANAKAALRTTGEHKTYLKLLASSGFEPVIARYIQTQPVTLLVPTDKAFASLPLRIKSQLTGSKLVKLLEYHMILQKFPVGFLRMAQPGCLFRTVFGVNLTKHRRSARQSIVFGPTDAMVPLHMAVVTRGNIAASKLLLLALHGVNNVILPPGIFF